MSGDTVLPSVQTLATEHAEELAALEDVIRNLKAVFSDAMVHMNKHESVIVEMRRLEDDVRVFRSRVDVANDALLQSKEKINDMASQIDVATAKCAQMAVVEEENACMKLEVQRVQAALDHANQRIANLQHMEKRVRELEEENADLKTVSRFVTLQNENDKLREELAKRQRSKPAAAKSIK